MASTTSPVDSRASSLQRLLQKRWIGWGLLILIGLAVAVRLIIALFQDPALFAQQIVNGLELGFVYALIALGYTMVYGIVKLINFAHGDVFMVGAFVSYFAITRFQMNLWFSAAGIPEPFGTLLGSILVILLSMATCALMAFTIERVAYKPLRTAPRISALITAIGVSFFLEYFGALPFVFTNNYITYQRPFEMVSWYVIKDGIHVLQLGTQAPANSLIFSSVFIIILITTLLLVVGLQFIVQRTKVGKAMRATAYDKPTARLMGINVDGIISVTFGIGAALAGAAGMLYATAFPQLVFGMGITPGLKAFVAAVLGGIGSIPGALVGALIMGQAETLSAGYISTPMRDAIAFTLLIVVLFVRPTGIFGEPSREKA
jgi:branched-chain amino acid transport system permease protein